MSLSFLKTLIFIRFSIRSLNSNLFVSTSCASWNIDNMSKASADFLLQAANVRRTIYPLTKTLPIPNSKVLQIVNEAALHTPSPFNAQTNRTLVLFGAEHDKLWDHTTGILKKIVPENEWGPTGEKLALFRGGAGTVLFFDDSVTVKESQITFKSYASRVPTWATQSLAMQQWITWTALGLEGVGGNLQHYDPLIDEFVQKEWNIPKEWLLNAQLVFGGKGGEATEKTFLPLEERVKVFGA